MTQLEKLVHAIELQRHLDAIRLLQQSRKEEYSVSTIREALFMRRKHTADLAYQLYAILTKMWGDDWDVVHNNYIVHLYNIEITTTTHLKHISHEVFFALPISHLILGSVKVTFAKTLFTLDEVPNWYIHSHVNTHYYPTTFQASVCFGNIFRGNQMDFYAHVEAIIAIIPQYLSIESVGTVPYNYISRLSTNRAYFHFNRLSRPTEPLTVRYSIDGNGVIEASVQDDAALDRWLAKDEYTTTLYQMGDALYYKRNKEDVPFIPRNWHVPYQGKLYRVRILDEYQTTTIPPLIKQLTINELNKRITLKLATKQRQEVYSGADTTSSSADTDSMLTSVG